MGLEVVVRPVVFPNIRPAPARALAPEDNPDAGIATITGGAGKQITLTTSWSVSVSRSRPYTETRRIFNKEQINQVDDKGNINPNNFVKVERLKGVRMDTTDGPIKMIYADPPPVPNVETLETDVVREAGS